ncbi:MAG TPA: hypothetical protein VG101_02720 [Puia sp.]|jgi:hypothetical protein|nr:hypothetical protein [Puia sp.]
MRFNRFHSRLVIMPLLVFSFFSGNAQDGYSEYLKFSSDGLLTSKVPALISFRKDADIANLGKRHILGFEITVPFAQLRQEMDSIEKGAVSLHQVLSSPDRSEEDFLKELLYDQAADIRMAFLTNWDANLSLPKATTGHDAYAIDTMFIPQSISVYNNLLYLLWNHKVPAGTIIKDGEYYIMMKGIKDTLYPQVIYDPEDPANLVFRFDLFGNNKKKVMALVDQNKLIEFQIMKKSKLKEACINWFNKLMKEPDFHRQTLDTVASFLMANAARFIDVDSVLMRITEERELGDDFHADSDNTNLNMIVNKVIGNPELYLNSGPYDITNIESVSYWVTSWLWLTGKNITLNPFNFTSTNKVPNRDTLKISNRVKYFARDIDSSVTKVSARHFTSEVANFKVLNDSLSGSKKDQETLQKQLKLDSAAKARYASFQQVSSILYKGYLLYSFTKKSNFTKENYRNYYDSAQNTLPVREKLDLNYSESDNEFIVYHNLPAGSKIIVVGNYSPIIEKSIVTKFWESSMDSTSLTSFFTNIGSAGINLNELGSSTPGKVVDKLATGENAAIFKKAIYASLLSDSSDRPYDSSIQHAYELGTAVALIDSLNLINHDQNKLAFDRQYYKLLRGIARSFPVPDSLKVTRDSTPNYMSQIYQVSSPKPAPSQYAYKIEKITKKDTSIIDTSAFNIGKRYRLRLSLGVEYTFNAISQITADTAGGKFQINNTYQPIHSIIALKLYPFHGLYLQDRSFRPRDLLSRTNLLLGVGFPNPLDNYYLGAGIDILPGLTVNGGVHFNRLNTYTIQSDQVLQQGSYLSTHWFFSLSVDPELFIQIFKTL